ncbi:guanine permease [Suicoccus acidiformans]|uniref:Guanine permease n=1 Tax=Suicoccus acidiformans TaxID=2036206 RepID=A0A347WHK8_9LACT|nr:NCS2 family permease [Suicoccus acidiformans]AXY24565.1 guanine permease [Suicoccus acidiformans]
MEFIQDLIAALGAMLNGIPQAIMAMGLGFSTFATSIGFFVGAILTFVFKSAAPLSFQAETLVLVGQQGENARERYSIVFWSSLLLLIIGLTGAVEGIIQWVGQDIIDGMMAGVGIMLAKIGVDNVKASTYTGGSSLITAVIIYLFTQDLLWCLIGSVAISSVVDYYFAKNQPVAETSTETKSFQFYKPFFNSNVVKGALSVTSLSVATSISYGLITGQMTGIEPNPVNVNHYATTQGVSNAISSLFGGAPIASVISATGASVQPVRAGILMMVILGALLAAGMMPKIAKFIPSTSIAGFLFVLGMFVTFPSNAANALAVANNFPAAMTLIITAVIDPFTGLVSGGLLKLFMSIL